MGGHVKSIKENKDIIAAKVTIYPGESEEYFTFNASEAFKELKKWMEYRKKEFGIN